MFERIPRVQAAPLRALLVNNHVPICSDPTERRSSANLFEITDRVEMGQMASMFFNKGNRHSGMVRGTGAHSTFAEFLALVVGLPC